VNEIETPADPTRVVFTAHPTTGDLIANAMAFTRRSAVAQTLGSFAVVTSIVGFIVLGEPVVLLFLLFGLSFLTGAFSVPFVWWTIRRRRDLVLAPVEIDADADGLSLTASYATSRQAWSVYRRVRETGRAFVMDTGAGPGAIITKRGVAPADVEAFRALLLRVGVLQVTRGASDLVRPVLWIALGAVAALALSLGPWALSSIGATASMSLSTQVGDGTVTVTGETDLPDGTVVLAQILQWDEWQGATADGVTPDVNTSPWVRSEQTVVSDGRFEATFSTAEWPAGRGLAVGYFWLDTQQPADVIERFGSRGQRLKGPDVTEDDVFGPTLEVQKVFDIP
jgi:hypothetical protein